MIITENQIIKIETIIIQIIRICTNLRIIQMKTIMRMMRICANTANDDANKNKFKVQNSKLKITT